ncbi:MAG: methylisocitrate lyase [Nitrospiraceae bacterium]
MRTEAKDRGWPQTSKPRRLRELIDQQTVVLPGAYNALTAMQIVRAGFQGVYVSGAALAASRGLPDIGLLSMTEVLSDASTIANAVAIPTLADVDTGYGRSLVAARTVREFERAGLAGIQIEDQENPKKCGHLSGKRVVPADEMVAKISAMVDARRDPDFVIIARTDARAVEGLDAAVGRAQAYAEAGADLIFPEALESREEFRTFAQHLASQGIKVPLVANMTEFGKTPYINVEEFEDLGYRLILFPVSTLRIATRAIEQFLQELHTNGTQQTQVRYMQTRQQLYDLLRYAEYEEREKQCHEQQGSDTL